MSRYEKDDTVIYKNQECKVEGVYFNNNYVLKTPDGKSVVAREEDLKDPTKVKRLDDIIKTNKPLSKDEEMKRDKTKEQEKENIKKQLEKETPKKPKEISFSVITKDYVNGKSNEYQTKETIINGKTKDGIKFEATVYGKDFNKKELENIAERIVLNEDFTVSKQDKSDLDGRAQNLLNSFESDYVIYVGNGVYKTAEEFMDDNSLKEANNLRDFGDQFPETDTIEDEEPEGYTNLEALLAAHNEERGGFSSQAYDEEYDDPDFDYEERSLF